VWYLRSYWHESGNAKSRFFVHHPRTYPKELSLFGAPGTFGAPFTQNDIADFYAIDCCLKQLCGVFREVRDDEVGAGATDANEGFEHGAIAFKPAFFKRSVEHGILA